MQTQKISPLPITAATPALPAPKTEGGDLFASELERASGGSGATAHRDQREAGETRRARQAARAQANDQTRAEARQGREASERTRKEKRSERLEARDAAAATGQEPLQRPTPQPREPQASAPRAPRPESPVAKHIEPTPEHLEPQAQDSGRPEQLSRDLGVAALVAARTSLPAPTAAPSQAPATPKVAPLSTSSETPQSNTQDPKGSSQRTTGPKPTVTRPADAMAELLIEREAELDRQAQVLRQVKAQLGPSARELNVQLSPASLGTVQLRLALRSGRLTGVLRASKPEALDALEKQLPELTTSLEAQGFDVVDFDLGLLGAVR